MTAPAATAAAAPIPASGGPRLAPGALEALQGPRPIRAWIGGDGALHLEERSGSASPAREIGFAPAIPIDRLGDPSFLSAHGVRAAYLAGAMAGGISSVDVVVAMARAGLMGAFGSGGLDLDAVDRAILAIQKALGPAQNYELNLLANPVHPDVEMRLVELYLHRRVPRISASGFVGLTAPLVLYRARGLSRAPGGRIVASTHILAKLSRPEVARELLEPAPEALLRKLIDAGMLTAAQAELAARVPVAEDITVEADSGGHTDNQPLIPLLSAICNLRDRIVAERGYDRPVRVGAAGGISTPATAAAAFVSGAAYVLTGSINQSCREAGTSEMVKQMLCGVDIGGVDMAPAGDMFEIGARVQVLKHRTLFPARARKLHELWRAHASWEDIPERERSQIETRFFRRPFAEVWRETEAYLRARDAARAEAAAQDPRQRMAWTFKWYLHMSSRWAIEGCGERSVDFQVWCGSSMAAFNQWAKGSFLDGPGERRVALLADNILHGAAALLRARILALQGVPLPPEAFQYHPRRFEEPGARP